MQQAERFPTYRLLTVLQKEDGTYFVQSRQHDAFDYRNEAGPYATAQEAHDQARTIAEGEPRSWAVQSPSGSTAAIAGWLG